jgi:hypothetical protein
LKARRSVQRQPTIASAQNKTEREGDTQRRMISPLITLLTLLIILVLLLEFQVQVTDKNPESATNEPSAPQVNGKSRFGDDMGATLRNLRSKYVDMEVTPAPDDEPVNDDEDDGQARHSSTTIRKSVDLPDANTNTNIYDDPDGV